MKAIIQRVLNAKVVVQDEVISSIGRGLCILIGISRDDDSSDMAYIVKKILNTRLFDDQTGKRWAKSVKDCDMEILCVSQFTLYHVLKGNKPDFHNAMGGQDSETFYNNFLTELKRNYKPDLVKNGKFGACMEVHITNDGPVTIDIESKKGDVKKKPVNISENNPKKKSMSDAQSSDNVKDAEASISNDN